MKTSTLLKVWVVLGLGWLLFFWTLATSSTAGMFRTLAWPLLGLALAVPLAIYLLYRRAARRHSGEVDGHLLIDASPTTAEIERSTLFTALLMLRRLPVLLVPLALVGLAVALLIPASRSALCRLAVAPHPPFTDSISIPALRVAGVRCLGTQPDDENLLALLRVANTADPERSPEALAAATSELLRLAGEAPAEASSEALGRINRWAAQRLGRQLDANGGIMAWFAVEGESHRRAVEALADEDALAASAAWDTFGAIDITTTEDFLWARGPALADPRPIHFVLHTHGGPPWARPEPREGYAGPVLAETVGEAVALSLWGYEGVGSAEFPTEFWTWWASYARARHLPPGGPGTRPARR